MINITENKIKEFLQNNVLLEKDVITKVKQRFSHQKSLKIVYGETYDKYGLTFDSLYYYFVLSTISKLLKSYGFDVIATLIVGDLASIRNDNVVEKEELLKQVEENYGLILELVKKYNLQIEVKKMSELFENSDYKSRLEKLKCDALQNEDVVNLLEKTVLKNRLKQEYEKGFQYALEEVALIAEYDIKIGPPREKYYDKIAEIIFGKLFGLYLKPTYPLGLNYDFFINNPEIEEFGVTPYKAGSNKLQDNRLIINKTTVDEFNELVSRTFVPSFAELPNPLFVLTNLIKLKALIAEKFDTELTDSQNLPNLFKQEFNEHFTK
jgi:hypothetical protein